MLCYLHKSPYHTSILGIDGIDHINCRATTGCYKRKDGGCTSFYHVSIKVIAWEGTFVITLLVEIFATLRFGSRLGFQLEIRLVISNISKNATYIICTLMRLAQITSYLYLKFASGPSFTGTGTEGAKIILIVVMYSRRD